MLKNVFFVMMLILMPSAAQATVSLEQLKTALLAEDQTELPQLLENADDINARDENGETLVLFAIKKHRSRRKLQMLINAGADINAPSSESGMTPLVYLTLTAEGVQKFMERKLAADSKSYSTVEKQIFEAKLRERAAKEMIYATKMIKFLIDNGVNLNQNTPQGTALMLASKSEWNKAIIDTLLQGGADVNQVDRNGRSALFYAAAFGGNDVVVQLLAADADTEIKDHDGKTYMEIEAKDMTKD